MTLGNTIAQHRKRLNITQDALAQKLGVTNQAVSKWESDQCCPDVMLLPRIADIFETTVDALFGRGAQPKNEADLSATKKRTHIFLGDSGKASCTAPTPGWPDDNILRVVVYVGQNMVCSGLAEKGYQFTYEGDVDGILSSISVSCGNVDGDVDAGRTVCCGSVSGNVDAGTSVSCGNVAGDVDAGTQVGCGQVGGNVSAGADVKCGDVIGDVDAGRNVECTRAEGDVNAGGSVIIRK